MNDKIEELMTKCNYVVDGTCDTSREEKFAELIVRECASICDRIEDEYLEKIEDEYVPDTVQIAVGAGKCCTEILHHFGAVL